jgi:putative tryptophan/tyrosine transport system substrate-binding protein
MGSLNGTETIGTAIANRSKRGRSSMQRREFMTALAGAVAATPLLRPRAASAQQAARDRRIGALMGLSESNPEHRAFFAAFIEELTRLKWVDGRNTRIEQRWTNADLMRASSFAAELVALQPDIILCSTTPVTAALHRETSSVPIVFTLVSDPLGSGFVAGLPHPGGNITGFVHTDATFGGKWLSLLKEIAPRIKRAAIMFNPDTAPDHGNFFLGSFEAAAQLLALEPVRLQVRSDAEIENAIGSLGREQGGLVLMDDSFMAVHYRTTISATLRDKVPALSVLAQFTKDGGLMSYVSSIPDQFRGAAGYVDRILRGDRPGDLPVQTPTKFESAINLTTAKALGLDIPPGFLAAADELIE